MIRDYVIGLDKVELTLKADTPVDASHFVPGPTVGINSTHTSTLDLFSINRNSYNDCYQQGSFTLMHIKNDLSAMYELAYKVYHYEVEVGKVFLNSRLNTECINFKVVNELCYDAGRFQTVTEEFLVTFRLRVNNVSALDIFIDCREDLIALFDTYFYDTESYHFISNNRTTVMDDHYTNAYSFSPLRRDGVVNRTYYVGKRTVTGKQVCIYNKSKEMLSKGRYKGYIDSLHQEYLQGTADVYRFELRLTSKYLYRKKYEIDTDRLFDVDYLKFLVEANLDRFIDFREKDKARPSRCTRVPLFDFSKEAGFVVAYKPCNNDSHKTNVVIKQKRIAYSVTLF